MDETSRNLTTRQDRALYALLTGRTVTEAAYAIDAVQQNMQEAINQWEQAVERLEALEKDS